MHRRVRRAAAPSINALWITDDLLAEAFHRFARVSHTARRYGSNVPGPLEAHRRSARRKMGLAAAAASSGPPAGDFGALFGWGGGQQLPLEKSWKWEAPSFGASYPPPRQSEYDIWPWTPPQAKRRRVDNPARVEEKRAKPAVFIHPVKASRTAFQELLAHLRSEQQIEKQHMTGLVDFLQSSADEPETKNTLALIQWLLPRTITDEALHVLAQCILEKVKLQTLSNSQLIPAIALLVERGATASVEACLVQTLEAVPDGSQNLVISKVSRHFRWLSEEQLNTVRRWLRILDACSYMQGTHHDNPIWRGLYQHFARHITLLELAEHLAELDHLDFAKVILRYWVPHMLHDDAGPDVTHSHREKNLSFHKPKLGEDVVQALIDDFEALREANTWQKFDGEEETAAEIATDRAARPTKDFPIIDLFVVLSRHKMSIRRLRDDVFELLRRTKHPLAVWGVFRALMFRPEPFIPRVLALDMIKLFLQTGQTKDLRRAWLVFKNVPTLSILHCFDLPLKLIEHGYGTPDRIFYMLNRKTGPEDIVAPEWRDKERCTLRPEHVDLVHLVAFSWASREDRSDRIGFRRVWECYRFLQDRGAPLSVLMSRALVKSGIMRPLREGRYLPVAQVRYIISLVQRLEGNEIARNLDRLVFFARKRNHKLFKHAPALEGLWAGRMDEGIVRWTKWRMKLWKLRPSPWVGGNEVQHGTKQVQSADGGDGSSDAEMSQFEPFVVPRKVASDTADQVVLRQEIDREAEQDIDKDEINDRFEDEDHEEPLSLDAQQCNLLPDAVPSDSIEMADTGRVVLPSMDSTQDNSSLSRLCAAASTTDTSAPGRPGKARKGRGK